MLGLAYGLSAKIGCQNRLCAQVLLQGGAKVEFEPNPFASEGGEELAAVAYRCVRLYVQDSPEGLIARKHAGHQGLSAEPCERTYQLQSCAAQQQAHSDTPAKAGVQAPASLMRCT